VQGSSTSCRPAGTPSGPRNASPSTPRCAAGWPTTPISAALRGYQLTLEPALRDLGAHLVAVSAQVPERLVAIKRRHGFGFRVASDQDHALIEAFGSGFDNPGADEHPGTDKAVFPYPGVAVVDRDRVVRFADVSPDWMVRTDAQPVIDAVRSLLVGEAAR
jgi:peroxiredoxin